MNNIEILLAIIAGLAGLTAWRIIAGEFAFNHFWQSLWSGTKRGCRVVARPLLIFLVASTVIFVAAVALTYRSEQLRIKLSDEAHRQSQRERAQAEREQSERKKVYYLWVQDVAEACDKPIGPEGYDAALDEFILCHSEGMSHGDD